MEYSLQIIQVHKQALESESFDLVKETYLNCQKTWDPFPPEFTYSQLYSNSSLKADPL